MSFHQQRRRARTCPINMNGKFIIWFAVAAVVQRTEVITITNEIKLIQWRFVTIPHVVFLLPEMFTQWVFPSFIYLFSFSSNGRTKNHKNPKYFRFRAEWNIRFNMKIVIRKILANSVLCNNNKKSASTAKFHFFCVINSVMKLSTIQKTKGLLLRLSNSQIKSRKMKGIRRLNCRFWTICAVCVVSLDCFDDVSDVCMWMRWS